MQKNRTYAEIFNDVDNAKYGKDCRRLHKELKRAGYSGLPMFMRYPTIPIICETISLILVIVIGTISVLRLL